MKKTVSLIVLSLLIIGAANKVKPQDAGRCEIGRRAAAIGFWTWAANTQVQVYIRSTDFDSKQVAKLLTALDNWNQFSEQTGSGIQFQYRGDSALERMCDNCLTILRGRVFNKKTRHATEIRANSIGETDFIKSAAIIVDPVLTNPEALLNAVVHELGHNLGLLDCYSCKRKSTVMNQLDEVNVPNGMDRPTACDIAQVKHAYERLKVKSLAANQTVALDEGEEPEDDDTPIVMPATDKRSLPSLPVVKIPPRPE